MQLQYNKCENWWRVLADGRSSTKFPNRAEAMNAAKFYMKHNYFPSEEEPEEAEELEICKECGAIKE